MLPFSFCFFIVFNAPEVRRGYFCSSRLSFSLFAFLASPILSSFFFLLSLTSPVRIQSGRLHLACSGSESPEVAPNG